MGQTGGSPSSSVQKTTGVPSRGAVLMGRQMPVIAPPGLIGPKARQILVPKPDHNPSAWSDGEDDRRAYPPDKVRGLTAGDGPPASGGRRVLRCGRLGKISRTRTVLLAAKRSSRSLMIWAVSGSMPRICSSRGAMVLSCSRLVIFTSSRIFHTLVGRSSPSKGSPGFREGDRGIGTPPGWRSGGCGARPLVQGRLSAGFIPMLRAIGRLPASQIAVARPPFHLGNSL